MDENTLHAALETLKQTAKEIQQCPSCQGHHIYSAMNVAYVYDHLTQKVGMREIINLAEHGWHGCYDCGHKWVSNLMLQTALPPKKPPADRGKVIDLSQCTKNKKPT